MKVSFEMCMDDIKEAIIFWLEAKGYKELDEDDIMFRISESGDDDDDRKLIDAYVETYCRVEPVAARTNDHP